MSNEGISENLHLPSLSIAGFRGIDHLAIPRLGRVTLLAGQNGTGKTTVLDAVRVYAARGRPIVLQELLETREEFATALDEDKDRVLFPDYAALFHGRDVERTQRISIGPNNGTDDFRIDIATPKDWSVEQKELFADLSANFSTEADVQAIRIAFQNRERLLPWILTTDRHHRFFARNRYFRRLRREWMEEGEWPAIACETLGPGLLSNNRLARFWDEVALTEEEDLSIEALRLILGEGIERVAIIGDDDSRYGGDGRRVVVKLRDETRPVSLKSLGDGVTRMFGVGLALANSRDGFLLIDEAENGIHYSIQQNFWRMVLRAAHQNNVQVLATTHSSDCWRGFAWASEEIAEVEGVLIRLERDGEGVRAVQYTEGHLKTAAEQGIEVR